MLLTVASLQVNWQEDGGGTECEGYGLRECRASPLGKATGMLLRPSTRSPAAVHQSGQAMIGIKGERGNTRAFFSQ